MIRPEHNGRIALTAATLVVAMATLVSSAANADSSEPIVAAVKVKIEVPPTPEEIAQAIADDVSSAKYTSKDALSGLELKSVLYSVGFRGKDLREAWAVAMKESNGRPMAHNRNARTGDNSHGLFQINMIGSLGPARLKQYKLSSNDELFDPVTNAKIAYQMSNAGKDWSAWHGIGSRVKFFMNEFDDISSN